jgi:hypothetical protein
LAGDRAFYKRVDAWDHILSARWPFLILRWLHSMESGSDRMRLTQPEAVTGELWERFIRYLERADALY